MNALAFTLFSIGGISIIVVLAMSGAFGQLGTGGDGSQTCDLAGTVSGTVNDVVLVPIFTNWNVQLSSVNCHETTISDSIGRWWRNILPPQGALIQVGGPYFIQVKIYDQHYKLQGVSECYSFTTGVIEVSKPFSFPISFSNFEKGETLIVNAYNECKTSAGIQQTFSKTV